uniref:Katanin p80 subunit B-like 1 n=1 Tax=Hucho hucho TaxID=62062 RepID=A0A4W5RDC8_9TELE
MASGSHYGQGREFHQLNQGKPHGFLHYISNYSTADKNMKEVSGSQRGIVVHASKPKEVSVCNTRKLSSRHSVVVSSGVRRRVPPAGRAVCDMANKENELTCPEEVQAIHYNDNCMFPVNSAAEAGSKMAGAGNKYSDYFTELSKDHDAMTHVLFGRNLRLNVALTLWRRNASELVAYLIRIEDTGVLLDCLPVITKSLQDETPCISLGCCVDLLPQVKSILTSEYEEHLIVVLHWVQSVVKKWWPELSTNGKSLLDSCSEDRYVCMCSSLSCLQCHSCGTAAVLRRLASCFVLSLFVLRKSCPNWLPW